MRSVPNLLAFMAFSLLWLPAGVVLLALIRGFMLPPSAHVWASLLPVAPAGLPLALSCWLLRRAGKRRTSWILFIVLAPVSAAAATVAGLLGPVGILVSGLVCSLPAWLMLGLFHLFGRQKQ